MPPKPLRQPTRKVAVALPQNARFTFLSQASKILTEDDCLDAAAYFGSRALKAADKQGAVVPRRNALQHCQVCGVYLSPNSCASIECVDLNRRSQQRASAGTSAGIPSRVGVPSPAAACNVVALVRVCKVCGHRNSQPFTSAATARELAATEAAAIEQLKQQRRQQRSSAVTQQEEPPPQDEKALPQPEAEEQLQEHELEQDEQDPDQPPPLLLELFDPSELIFPTEPESEQAPEPHPPQYIQAPLGSPSHAHNSASTQPSDPLPGSSDAPPGSQQAAVRGLEVQEVVEVQDAAGDMSMFGSAVSGVADLVRRMLPTAGEALNNTNTNTQIMPQTIMIPQNGQLEPSAQEAAAGAATDAVMQEAPLAGGVMGFQEHVLHTLAAAPAAAPPLSIDMARRLVEVQGLSREGTSSAGVAAGMQEAAAQRTLESVSAQEAAAVEVAAVEVAVEAVAVAQDGESIAEEGGADVLEEGHKSGQPPPPEATAAILVDVDAIHPPFTIGDDSEPASVPAAGAPAKPPAEATMSLEGTAAPQPSTTAEPTAASTPIRTAPAVAGLASESAPTPAAHLAVGPPGGAGCATPAAAAGGTAAKRAAQRPPVATPSALTRRAAAMQAATAATPAPATASKRPAAPLPPAAATPVAGLMTRRAAAQAQAATPAETKTMAQQPSAAAAAAATPTAATVTKTTARAPAAAVTQAGTAAARRGAAQGLAATPVTAAATARTVVATPAAAAKGRKTAAAPPEAPAAAAEAAAPPEAATDLTDPVVSPTEDAPAPTLDAAAAAGPTQQAAAQGEVAEDHEDARTQPEPCSLSTAPPPPHENAPDVTARSGDDDAHAMYVSDSEISDDGTAAAQEAPPAAVGDPADITIGGVALDPGCADPGGQVGATQPTASGGGLVVVGEAGGAAGVSTSVAVEEAQLTAVPGSAPVAAEGAGAGDVAMTGGPSEAAEGGAVEVQEKRPEGEEKKEKDGVEKSEGLEESGEDSEESETTEDSGTSQVSETSEEETVEATQEVQEAAPAAALPTAGAPDTAGGGVAGQTGEHGGEAPAAAEPAAGPSGAATGSLSQVALALGDDWTPRDVVNAIYGLPSNSDDELGRGVEGAGGAVEREAAGVGMAEEAGAAPVEYGVQMGSEGLGKDSAAQIAEALRVSVGMWSPDPEAMQSVENVDEEHTESSLGGTSVQSGQDDSRETSGSEPSSSEDSESEHSGSEEESDSEEDSESKEDSESEEEKEESVGSWSEAEEGEGQSDSEQSSSEDNEVVGTEPESEKEALEPVAQEGAAPEQAREVEPAAKELAAEAAGATAADQAAGAKEGAAAVAGHLGQPPAAGGAVTLATEENAVEPVSTAQGQADTAVVQVVEAASKRAKKRLRTAATQPQPEPHQQQQQLAHQGPQQQQGPPARTERPWLPEGYVCPDAILPQLPRERADGVLVYEAPYAPGLLDLRPARCPTWPRMLHIPFYRRRYLRQLAAYSAHRARRARERRAPREGQQQQPLQQRAKKRGRTVHDEEHGSDDDEEGDEGRAGGLRRMGPWAPGRLPTWGRESSSSGEEETSSEGEEDVTDEAEEGEEDSEVSTDESSEEEDSDVSTDESSEEEEGAMRRVLDRAQRFNAPQATAAAGSNPRPSHKRRVSPGGQSSRRAGRASGALASGSAAAIAQPAVPLRKGAPSPTQQAVAGGGRAPAASGSTLDGAAPSAKAVAARSPEKKKMAVVDKKVSAGVDKANAAKAASTPMAKRSASGRVDSTTPAVKIAGAEKRMSLAAKTPGASKAADTPAAGPSHRKRQRESDDQLLSPSQEPGSQRQDKRHRARR